MLLKVNDIHASYGPVVALRGISLEIPEGGIVSVLGANGAGKSSTLRAISGLVRLSRGSIEFMGRRIDQHHRPRRRPARFDLMRVDLSLEVRKLVPLLAGSNPGASATLR